MLRWPRRPPSSTRPSNGPACRWPAPNWPASVSSVLVPQTSIITLSVQVASAREAAELANAIAATLIDQIEKQTPPGGAVRVTGSVVESPEIPTAPAAPSLVFNLAVAFAVGLFVAFLTIVFRQALAAGPRDRS